MRDRALTETLGRLNLASFYGAPAVCVVFGPKNFLYSVPDAFCCAENMVLMAADLGLASCIVARGGGDFRG